MSLPKETMEILEALAPELKESEDERIRKVMLEHFKSKTKETWCGLRVVDILAYLEKQKEPLTPEEKMNHPLYLEWFDVGKKVGETLKEQKPAEPSDEELQRHQNELYDFKVFAARQAREHHISFVHDFEWNNFCAELLSYFNEKQKPFNVCEQCPYYKDCPDYNEQRPAEWKPQPESLEALMYAIEGKWEMIKPTSYLSRRLEDLYDGLVNTYNVDEAFLAELPKTAYTAEDIEELKVLKDKIDASMDEKPAEWSKNDTVFLNEITDFFENKTVKLQHDLDMYAHWLKSLPERFTLQTKQEWSEEDEKTISDACCWLAEYAGYLMDKNYGKASMLMGLVDRLKSLRPVSKESLQSHWKPSEEQMKMLAMFSNLRCVSRQEAATLESLYNNLKKLM